MPLKPYRLKLLCLADGSIHESSNKYVRYYDVDYVSPGGYDGGRLYVTEDPNWAKPFDTAGEAFEVWNSVAPPPYDKRPDGKPNRPLTAFTCEVSRA